MESVEAVAAAVVAAVAVGSLAVWGFRRRSHGDVDSVRHYTRALHTLQGMRGRPSREPGPAEVEPRRRLDRGRPLVFDDIAGPAAGQRSAGPPRAPAEAAQPVPAQPLPAPPHPAPRHPAPRHAPPEATQSQADTPLVFDDVDVFDDGEELRASGVPEGRPRVVIDDLVDPLAPGQPEARPPLASDDVAAPRAHRRQQQTRRLSDVEGAASPRVARPEGKTHRTEQWSEAAPRRRSGRQGGMRSVAAVIVALGAATAVVGVLRDRPHAAATSSSTASTGTTQGTAVSGHHHQSAPTTTQPSHYTATSSTATTATYRVPTGSYSLSVSATTSDCWVQVTTSSGAVDLSQTLAPGSSQSLTMSGDSTLLIGAPSVVAIAIDGAPVVLPPGAQAPFTATFASGSSSG